MRLEVRSVFLDISKAFDKVQHELTKPFAGFFKGKKRVALNGKVSKWKNINTGVPQVSIHVPLFFLIYINEGLTANAKLFADNTSLFSVVHDT